MSHLPDRRSDWSAHERPFASTGQGRPARRPNIVFILADDLGWGDLGCYGSLHNSTPVLDRLAADGVRLTHGYAASPTCSPTRISLYTGRYPGRLEGGLQEPLVTRDSRSGIPAGHPTLPSLLKGEGYDTAMFGKWHCGWLPWFSPLKIGFDVFFGNLDGAMDYFSHIDSRGEPDLYEGETPVEETGYYTEIVSAKAADYIRSRTPDTPFYLQVNYTAPHWPWEGPADEAVSEKVTAATRREQLTGLFHFEGGSLDTYRVMVEALDAGIGQVMDALDERGLREDTIVVFASDNGGERFAFLWPFVGEKGDLEEGGIRVPFIVRWPAALAAGQVTDVPTITMDWTATLLDAAGAAAAPTHPLDGVSLLPWLLEGADAPERDLLWRTRGQGALRRGRHKFLYDRTAKPLWQDYFGGEGPRGRLFDVTADGREKADLSRELPDLYAELLKTWQEFDAALLPYPPQARPSLADGEPD
ncbi:sulfatase-like hydrolase/transferase [Streptosporangium carneum]|uniref:N-acetylgalactosamine-6-sulfatase n=1 Tax=Streptosporangium carneum TaxID=47481 RepID=A0A9W6MH80_9ACTN|nr:sulfatase-like hydrolase/transferase [Streptosporangium carneum]GLK13961.1 N-acetylgalactosamine-6-sulfatase [Streptosporangium carneum]